MAKMMRLEGDEEIWEWTYHSVNRSHVFLHRGGRPFLPTLGRFPQTPYMRYKAGPDVVSDVNRM
jgi:hypothetical protein